MSQYTDYIRQASEDFAEIDKAEKLSCIMAMDGRLETHFNHGGFKIEILRDNTEYDGVTYMRGDVIEEPPTDPYYLKLKEKWSPKESDFFNKIIRFFTRKKG